MTFSSWEQTFRYIVKQAEHLPEYPAALREDAHRVSGCEAQVWLAVDVAEPMCLVRADSDSRLVRGLLAMIVDATDGRAAAELRNFDVNAELERRGVLAHLNPARLKGVQAVAQAIRVAVG